MKALPLQLLNDLHQVKEFDEKEFIAAHTQPALTSVRMHTLKHTDAYLDAEKVPWCENGRYLKERPVFTLDPYYHAGAYYVQEASSMFLDYLIRNILPDNKGLRVLDLCAAPGGKSTLLASFLGEDSLLISNDVIRSRATILEENITRWGYMNTWVTSNDPKDFAKLDGYFDMVVIDAPCSGSGLFRKDERALELWSEDNVQLCSQRQQRILADVWPSLKENGILIYATCSYSPQEDEQILDWLADEFEVESLSVTIPEWWGIVTTVSQSKKIAGYRFFPDKTKGEGLFIAALQKKEIVKQVRHKYAKAKQLSNDIIKQAAFLLNNRDWLCIEKEKNNYAAIRPEHEADFALLSKAVYIRRLGLPIGMPSSKDWIPDHAVALGVDANEHLNSISVNKEQALLFLKKEEFYSATLPKGWYLVKYNGLGIGWVKSLGNRFNNYLPKHWRIRMEITDADWA